MEKTISSKSYLALIEWLKKARLTRGLTIRELAAILDLPSTTIHRIETLERRLDINEYVLYCHALHLDPTAGIVRVYRPRI